MNPSKLVCSSAGQPCGDPQKEKSKIDEVLFRKDIKDVKEPQQVEGAQPESELSYRAMLGGFEGLIYICSPDYRLEFMNPQLSERTGYDGTGEHCYKVLYGRNSVCPWCVNEQVFRGETVRYEVQSPKDGRWYYVVNTPICHREGRISQQAMLQDITGLKQTEEALGQSEIMYRTLVEAAPSGISIIGKDGRYKYLNPKFVQMFGYALEDIPTGREWFPKAFPDASYREMAISEWKEEFKQARVGEVDAKSFRVTCKDGTVKVIDFRPVALVTGDWLMFYEDISQRVQAEEALRQSEEKLRALAAQLLSAQEDERKRLAVELHDELGHALLTLKLSIKSLEKQLTPEQISLTRELKKISRSIGETIKEVRRLYHDLSPGDLEDLGLTEALRDMIEDMTALRKKITWEVRLDNLDGLFALPVQTAIYRVVQEALTNIGKHAKAKNVTIVAQRGSHEISISIEDDGRGFEVAKGLDAKGSLGLLSMEERVKILGGTFTLRSQKNRGTRISFSVPFPGGD